MKGLSIRWKITLWFSAAIVLMTALAVFSELKISGSLLQKEIQDQLVEIVENNVDEVEFYQSKNVEEKFDLYIDYKEGFLEIDDDFLDIVNGIYTALYEENGWLLYGENPIVRSSQKLDFSDGKIQTIKVERVRYYIYDRKLEGENLEDLWLRGIVSEEDGTNQIYFITRLSLILLPGFCLLAVLGGYWIAGHGLQPINQIQRTVDSIRESDDLSRRINIGKGKDELHWLANTFDEMFERMETVFLQQKKFTYDASHELRTPVSVILSQCEYSLSEPQSEEEYIEALELIERQGRKMSSMINELLTISRLEQKKGKIEMELFDFSGMVEMVCQDMALIREKDISLESDIESGIFIEGNSSLLTRLLNNLIVNAYRYGKEKGHIYVRLLQTGEEIQLSVTDDGIGIAPEALSQIWNRFYQADTSRSGQGSGLGLSIVKEIAEAHKGKMTVDSTLEEGSTFILHLKNF